MSVFAVLIGSLGCASPQVRKETVLEKQLVMLNQAAEQFAAHHGRAPESVSDLLLGGDLKELPVDPFTGRNDTWKVVRAEGPEGPGTEIRSGSDAISSRGTPYNSW